MTALVSVVMPVLNGAAYLRESTDSILAQSHGELELVLVDDGSSDGTQEMIAEYARADARVKALYLERDSSLTSSARAANAGIAIAQGDYVARMDSDDIASPERLEVQVAHMRRHGLDVCGAQAIAFADDGDRPYWFPAEHAAIERELIFRVGILHPTMIVTGDLMRRSPYKVGASWEDYEWETRVSASARMGNCSEVLLRHRVHPQQANIRHAPLFRRDLRRYRFAHLYRLYPHMPADEYYVLNLVAERAPLRGPAELETAGQWLVRLADLPDPGLHRRMGKRWRQACDASELPDDDPVRLHYAGLIEGDAGPATQA